MSDTSMNSANFLVDPIEPGSGWVNITITDYPLYEIRNYKLDNFCRTNSVIKIILDQYKSIAKYSLFQGKNVSENRDNVNNFLESHPDLDIKTDDVLLIIKDELTKDVGSLLCISKDYIFGTDKNYDIFKDSIDYMLNLEVKSTIFDGIKGKLTKNKSKHKFYYYLKLYFSGHSLSKLKQNQLFNFCNDLTEINKVDYDYCRIHPIYSSSKAFRLNYFRLLYNMLISDFHILGIELKELYRFAKILVLKESDILDIIENDYPFSESKILQTKRDFFKNIEKYNDLKYIFIKDLITIIYSDKKKVTEEVDFLKTIARQVGCEWNIVNKLENILIGEDVSEYNKRILVEYLKENLGISDDNISYLVG